MQNLGEHFSSTAGLRQSCHAKTVGKASRIPKEVLRKQLEETDAEPQLRVPCFSVELRPRGPEHSHVFSGLGRERTASQQTKPFQAALVTPWENSVICSHA